MTKIMEDAMGRQHIIINPSKPPAHVIAASIDEFKRHQILWSGKAEAWNIPYAYRTNGNTDIFLYQIKNLVNPPKATNATTSYWWEYCCTKDFIFSTNQSDTSPYPWYIIKADKNGNVLNSYGPVNCGYLGSICTDDQYLYTSYVVVDGYNFTSYLIKLDWDLNLITSLEIGEYMSSPI